MDWYDKTGAPIEVMAANKLLSDPDYKRVALTRVISASDPGIKFDISTVWLGLDHNYHNDGPPVIFETMVFGSNDRDWADQLCQRYCTETEALIGHAEIVATVAATVTDEIVVN